MPKKKGGAPLEFDIIGPEGAALQSDGKYGRSVRFKDGTEYVIEVTNKIYAHYAVAIKIDGQKVTTTPMVIFPKGGRKISGFTDKKIFSRETNEDATARHCLCINQISWRLVHPTHWLICAQATVRLRRRSARSWHARRLEAVPSMSI